MKVKDYLSGAFTALATTIVGGIIVYYATKEPEQRSQDPLAYSVRSSASFSGSKEQMSVASVNIQNRGGKAAKNVIATIQFDSPLIRNLASESIPGAPVTKKVTDRSAIIEYSAILPGETKAIDFLLKTPATPKVVVRSDESLARQLAGSEELMRTRRSWNATASALVHLSGLFLGVVSAFALKTLRSQGGFS
jgi:hypothetical protein